MGIWPLCSGKKEEEFEFNHHRMPFHGFSAISLGSKGPNLIYQKVGLQIFNESTLHQIVLYFRKKNSAHLMAIAYPTCVLKFGKSTAKKFLLFLTFRHTRGNEKGENIRAIHFGGLHRLK